MNDLLATYGGYFLTYITINKRARTSPRKFGMLLFVTISDEEFQAQREDSLRRILESNAPKKLVADIELREHEGFITVGEAEEIIQELHALDPSGEAFRYASKKDGTPALPSSLTHVDLKRLLGRVLSVGMLLDGIESAVYEHKQWQSDVRSYYSE